MIKNNLSKLMSKRRLSMAEVARRTGLSANTVFYIYHGKSKKIKFEVVNKLCKILKCNIGELFEYIND